MARLSSAPGESSSVALALVNSLHRGAHGATDDLLTPAEVTGWLRSRSLFQLAEPALGERDVWRLGQLRAAVRELFLACAEARVADAGALHTVNLAAAGTPGAPSVEWSADGPVRTWTTVSPGTFEEALATVAADAIDVVCGHWAPLVRRCEAHGCLRLFFREHARRRWCSTTCGDRVRAARHYRLQQTQVRSSG
jgi:predicted RNA-binding Zn ribbon-like protein